MCGNIVCVAAVLLGIDAGWQVLPDGGIEYQIQIEPEIVENLDPSGVLIQSDVPAQVRDIRSFRITVGKAQLTRAALPATTIPTEPAQSQTAEAPAAKPAADTMLPRLSTPAIEFGPNWLSPVGRPEIDENAAGPPGPSPETDSLSSAADESPSPTIREVPAAPKTLSPDVQQAVLIEPASTASNTASGQKTDSESGPPTPWVPLTLTLLALFASLGANVFLLWTAADFRRRYRTLAGRMGEVATG